MFFENNTFTYWVDSLRIEIHVARRGVAPRGHKTPCGATRWNGITSSPTSAKRYLQ